MMTCDVVDDAGVGHVRGARVAQPTDSPASVAQGGHASADHGRAAGVVRQSRPCTPVATVKGTTRRSPPRCSPSG